jgi:hypothetical protein
MLKGNYWGGERKEGVEEEITNGNSQAWWCMSVIPATQEVKIRSILAQGQPRQKKKNCETPSQPIKAGHGGTCLS